MIANSGRFPAALALILGDAPFARFLSLADWLYTETRQTHQIALDRLYDLVHAGLVAIMGCSNEVATHALERDYANSGARGAPAFLKHGISGADKTEKPNRQTKPHTAIATSGELDSHHLFQIETPLRDIFQPLYSIMRTAQINHFHLNRAF